MEHDAAMPRDHALEPLAPGPLIRIACGELAVDIAPSAGGRIAQITRQGVAWLVEHSQENEAMIAWGSYPMVPWAGRIRHGQFRFQGSDYQLPCNLGEHAIHGVGFGAPWQVDDCSPTHAVLSLALPEDAHWPFGGTARQRIEVSENTLRLVLTVTAGTHAMPATIGWHPWFQKPDRLDFEPAAMYPRDDDGIATLPLSPPVANPWDDCFVNQRPVFIHRLGQRLQLSSDCTHWVIYDQPAHATCVEPQSGPPDAFNLTPNVPILPGASASAWFLFEW